MYGPGDECPNLWGGVGTCLAVIVFFTSIVLITIIWEKYYPKEYQKLKMGVADATGMISIASTTGAIIIFLVFNFILPLLFCW